VLLSLSRHSGVSIALGHEPPDSDADRFRSQNQP
jgi:hypothetical protein